MVFPRSLRRIFMYVICGALASVVISIFVTMRKISGHGEELSEKVIENSIQLRYDYTVPQRIKFHPLCGGIFQNNKTAIDIARNISNTSIPKEITAEEYLMKTAHCKQFIKERGYITSPLSAEENEFPIAFSITMYKDLVQAERLLRAIYMPQNFYCIHVDKKPGLNNSVLYKATAAVAACLPNVFMASKRENVEWGTWSVLQAGFNCMEDLLKRSKKWKYFIDLTGQEMPMMSNRQLVRVLKIYNGATEVETNFKRMEKQNTQYVHEGLKRTNKRKSPPPYGITVVKGSLHTTASRAFVEFALHNPKALNYRDWLKDTRIPDERFFSTLINNPQLGTPSAHKEIRETDKFMSPFLTRFVNWGSYPFDYHGKCYGKKAKGVCVTGIGDLPHIVKRKELFINKFYWDFEHLSLDCWEELQFNRTVESVSDDFEFDDGYYRSLSFIKR